MATAYSGSSRYSFPGVSVLLLDAALGVEAVATHIQFAARAVIARFGVGTAHYAHDQLARREAAASGRLDHFAERFVAEDQAVLARRRFAVFARDNLNVGAADPDGQPPDQHRALRRFRRRNIEQFRGVRSSRMYGQCFHRTSAPGYRAACARRGCS